MLKSNSFEFGELQIIGTLILIWYQTMYCGVWVVSLQKDQFFLMVYVALLAFPFVISIHQVL